MIWCYHGRKGPRHAYEPGEYCPPGGPVVEGACPGCGAPQGYPPGGPCLDHGTAKARALDALAHADPGEPSA